MNSFYSYSVWISILFLILKLIFSQSLGVEEDIEPNNLSYFCDFIMFGMAVLYISKARKEFLFIYVAFVIILITYSISTILAERDLLLAIKSLLRTFIPLFVFAHYASYFSTNNTHLLHICLLVTGMVLFLTLLGFGILPPALNRDDGIRSGTWWPAYFINIHTTTYVFSGVFFSAFALYKYGYTKISRNFVILVFILCFYFIAFGWGIRTSTLAILIVGFLSLYILVNSKFKNASLITLPLLIYLSILFFLFIMVYVNSDTLSSLTSGRTSMYIEKYYQIKDNSFTAWIIGNGAGSDLIETDVWWWALKGAHSDFITTLVEGGVIYFGVFILIHYKLYFVLKYSETRFIVLAIAFSGIVSNGFFSRPLALYVVVISLVIGYCDSEIKRRLVNVKN
jgi:hypothetical protein